MRLHKLFIILFLLSGATAEAQTTDNSSIPYQAIDPSLQAGSGLKPMQFNLRTGAMFSSGYGGGGLFNTYVAPSFNQPLGKKFTLSAGAVISNTTFNNVPLLNEEGSFSPTSGNLTTYTLYTSGSYQVNDRLTVSGSAYKTINPAFNQRLNPENLQMEAQGMSFGIGYKVGENMHIGAEFRMNQGNSNFYQPYYGFPSSGLMQNGFYGY